jgi:hypothetical protein
VGSNPTLSAIPFRSLISNSLHFGVCLGGKLVSLTAKDSRSGPSSEIDKEGRIYAIPELDIENTRD